MTVIQKGFHSNEDYIDFINYAFGMNGATASFPALLPKLYKDGRESDKVTYFAIDNDRIVGTVGAFPLAFHIGNTPLSARGIGSVATHPRRRGEGFMKDMMKKAIDDMIEDDIDFSVLGGRRHRYGFFGFEKCDNMMYFSLTPKTISYVKPDTENLSMKAVEESDTELLDQLYREMHKRPYYTERPREDLYDILLSWRSRPYAFFENKRLVGWAIHYESKRQLSEFRAIDLSRACGMLALAVRQLGALSVAVPTFDTPLAEQVDIVAENAEIVSNECFLIFNWQKVLSALLSFENTHKPLVNGSLVVRIMGVKGDTTLRLAIENGNASVETTDLAPEITLSQTEAEALFFRNYSALRQRINPEAASWLPLPLFIFEPDNV